LSQSTRVTDRQTAEQTNGQNTTSKTTLAQLCRAVKLLMWL